MLAIQATNADLLMLRRLVAKVLSLFTCCLAMPELLRRHGCTLGGHRVVSIDGIRWCVQAFKFERLAAESTTLKDHIRVRFGSFRAVAEEALSTGQLGPSAMKAAELYEEYTGAAAPFGRPGFAACSACSQR